ncbi:oligopeptidase B [Ahniella affigens]|uniref:Oligopeptidase B n=1 Tax=Ahniella affigens TaxID=2021234 RepID=A0A2P1PZD0_9GAMM|nr:S9 family peptidase [Ahniella affigens]AVQ00209.1 oligopeptidase B [Ahniella affigens]
MLAACSPEPTTAPEASATPTPPVAAKRPYEVVAPHGAKRQDEYYWLRDDSRQNPEMLQYLEAENRYADAVLAPQQALRDTLYAELTGRIQQDDSTVPYRKSGYWHYTRYEAGQEYPIHARRKDAIDAPEEVLLDVNALAAGKGFYRIGAFELSPDQTLLAYSDDTVGRLQYRIHIKDLSTGDMLPDVIDGAAPDILWAKDQKRVFYIENDPVTLLSTRVKQHVLGTDPSTDTVVYEETDKSYYLSLYQTTSEAFLCVHLESTVSTEDRCTPAANPGAFEAMVPRERDFIYYADHLNGQWFLRTNWDAPNFRVVRAASSDVADRSQWQDVVAHDPKVFIGAMALFNGFLAVEARRDGLNQLRILPNDGESTPVAADEPAYFMELDVNAEPDTDWVRYRYASLATPNTVYELNVKTGERKQLKQDTILGGFERNNYVVERVWAPSRDGTTQIPVSLLYRKGFEKNGKAALFQYGYGSYGSNTEPVFNSTLLSLVDRGVVYAIAHVRGGQEMGRDWYEQGRLMLKVNTFNDFIDVTRYLVAQGYADKKRVAAMGRSAGGLLMGAITNMAPDDYRVIVTQVPFVDVVTTMLDESIPLTTNEFDEWGNPADPAFYEYMLSYSPYDQIEAKAYPSLYVGTGLWDSQVQYFEPAKYVARMRAKKADNNPLVFRVNMEAGHGGKSGRLQRFREASEYQAFMLTELGIKQ